MAIIAAVENHFLPPFASLEPPSSTPPSEKQWDCYLSFLEELVLSSEQEHGTNDNIDLLFVLGWNIILTGAHFEEGGWRCRILGYLMAGAFFDCFEVVAVAKKSEKKKGKKKKSKRGEGNE